MYNLLARQQKRLERCGFHYKTFYFKHFYSLKLGKYSAEEITRDYALLHRKSSKESPRLVAWRQAELFSNSLYGFLAIGGN